MRIKNSFLFGLITGLGLGYYLATDDKEELIENIKDTAGKMKDRVASGIEKGKKLVEDMKWQKEES